MPLERPIPALYCCYLLRSTVRHSSLYIGSTPNPVRRLKQHNGLVKGGAVRTSRDNLRPWEMACIVKGFPSHTAALQFEWAFQNPHLSKHIPGESRLTVSIGTKKSGRPKRPRHSLISLLSNLHLLLRVPSFSRWPLELNFFSPDVYKVWIKYAAEVQDQIRSSLPVVCDFPPQSEILIESELPPSGQGTAELDVEGESDAISTSKRRRLAASYGIGALPVTYKALTQHVAKAKAIFDFELEESCAVCSEKLEHDGGMYGSCPHDLCSAVSHLTCLSTHFLDYEQNHSGRGNDVENNEDDQDLVPLQGTCPSCTRLTTWVDIVKEFTLRSRGQKEIDKLLKPPREKKEKAVKVPKAIVVSTVSKLETTKENAKPGPKIKVGKIKAATVPKSPKAKGSKRKKTTASLTASNGLSALIGAAALASTSSDSDSDSGSSLSDLDDRFLLEEDDEDVNSLSDSDDSLKELHKETFKVRGEHIRKELNLGMSESKKHGGGALGLNGFKGKGKQVVDMAYDRTLDKASSAGLEKASGIVIEDSDWDEAELID